MKDDNVVFQTDTVGKIKLFYKNGSTYTINGVTDFAVVERIGGGHDVEYAKVVETPEEFGNRTDIAVFQTRTKDVVAFEARNVVIFGIRFNRVYKRL